MESRFQRAVPVLYPGSTQPARGGRAGGAPGERDEEMGCPLTALSVCLPPSEPLSAAAESPPFWVWPQRYTFGRSVLASDMYVSIYLYGSITTGSTMENIDSCSDHTRCFFFRALRAKKIITTKKRKHII